MGSERRELPQHPEIGLIAAVPDAWGGPFMPRHQLLLRLARYFHVVWIDQPMSWRTPPEIFLAMARAVAPFTGLSYDTIGSQGAAARS